MKKLEEFEMKNGEELENIAEEVEKCQSKQRLIENRMNELQSDNEVLEVKTAKDIVFLNDIKSKLRVADNEYFAIEEERKRRTKTGRQPRGKRQGNEKRNIGKKDFDDAEDSSKSPHSSSSVKMDIPEDEMDFKEGSPNFGGPLMKSARAQNGLSVIISHESGEDEYGDEFYNETEGVETGEDTLELGKSTSKKRKSKKKALKDEKGKDRTSSTSCKTIACSGGSCTIF